MSDETRKTGEGENENTAGSSGESAIGGDTGAGEAAADEAPKERVDADGLPLDRDATIDDVRSQEGKHGRIAFGCTLFVVLLLVLFWLIRGGVIG